MVQITLSAKRCSSASRIDPQHPVGAVGGDLDQRTSGPRPQSCPAWVDRCPNDVFTEVLKLPTVWVPHSYPGSANHAPNENVPVAVVREGLGVMAGLYWDLGEAQARALAANPVPIDTR